jgi:hypothetical protein
MIEVAAGQPLVMQFDGIMKQFNLWYQLYTPHGELGPPFLSSAHTVNMPLIDAHNFAGVSIPSWPSLGRAEDGTSRLGSTRCFNFLKSCLKDCVENTTHSHRACIQPQPAPVPKQVLCVRPQEIRICDMEGEFGRYCALSYRWGPPEQVFKTTQANLSQMMQIIDWHVLPRLMQDTITVTRELDIQYLWIDAVCIIQEDEEDWLSESAKMGQY